MTLNFKYMVTKAERKGDTDTTFVTFFNVHVTHITKQLQLSFLLHKSILGTQ